jgi:hypothetical protein
MPSEFSANASALGYMYQIRYALLLLIRAGRDNPGIELSFENLDDIVFEEEGTPVELIQTKHHIKSTASLSDSGTELWKTLRIWSTALSRREISIDDTMLSLVTTGRAMDGTAASLLRPNKLEGRNEKLALEILLKVARSSSSTVNKPAYDIFLKLNEEQQIELIRKINILDFSPSILNVREQIIKELTYSARPEHLDSIYERLEGWWFNMVVKHLLPNSSVKFSQRALMDKIIDLQELFHLDNLPIDFPSPIDVAERELGEDQRIFVEQLRHIMLSEPRIRMAISDYYRAFEQRSKWIREELLFVDELESYERRLIDEWERRFDIMKEDMGNDPKEEQKRREGRSLFNWVDTQASIYIRPRCTEPYVIRGSYHILADDLRVGWHVDFINRLQHLLSVTSMESK